MQKTWTRLESLSCVRVIPNTYIRLKVISKKIFLSALVIVIGCRKFPTSVLQHLFLRTNITTRGAGVFLPGGGILKKGTFFVEKALPTKANFDSHAAI